VGKDKTHLKLQISDGRTVFDAIAFRMGHWAENMPSRLDLLYSYDINTFNGRTTVQLMVRDIQPYEPDPFA